MSEVSSNSAATTRYFDRKRRKYAAYYRGDSRATAVYPARYNIAFTYSTCRSAE